MRDTLNPIDAIWAADALGREEDARYLQNYLCARYTAKPSEGGFVLAVNADWGHGKSFMLDRWMKEAVFQGHPAVYFDAWKNDFTGDPLLAFISELEEGLTAHFKKIPIGRREKAKALSVLKKIWKPAVTIIASAAAKHVAGMSLDKIKEAISDDDSGDDDGSGDLSCTVKETAKSLNEVLKKALEPHKTVKESIARFKDNLRLLISHLESLSNVQLPLLIFVDELDRCRPDYAIELLEGIKHLFGVPGVTFVVATNIVQLSESIKAVYGAGFDGQKYLQRFFDLQYTLARPDNRSFSKLMLSEVRDIDSLNIIYGLEFDTTQHPRDGVVVTHGKIDYLAGVVAAHADAFGLTLRDIAQLVTILEACFIALRQERVHIFFLIFLASIYQKNPVVFKKFSAGRALDNNPDLQKLYEVGEGNIKIDYRGQNDSLIGTTDISIYNIASYYMQRLKTDNPHVSQNGFPNRNVEHVDYERAGNTYVAKFDRYFAIVQQAGGFRVKP